MANPDSEVGSELLAGTTEAQRTTEFTENYWKALKMDSSPSTSSISVV
jgi:hypothetical protein